LEESRGTTSIYLVEARYLRNQEKKERRRGGTPLSSRKGDLAQYT
jgi:hypothetical protein